MILLDDRTKAEQPESCTHTVEQAVAAGVHQRIAIQRDAEDRCPRWALSRVACAASAQAAVIRAPRCPL